MVTDPFKQKKRKIQSPSSPTKLFCIFIEIFHAKKKKTITRKKRIPPPIFSDYFVEFCSSSMVFAAFRLFLFAISIFDLMMILIIMVRYYYSYSYCPIFVQLLRFLVSFFFLVYKQQWLLAWYFALSLSLFF